MPQIDPSQIRFRDTPEGVLIPVRAQPKASREAVVGVHDCSVKVAVFDPPEKGKANRAIEAVIAEWLGVPKSTVSVIQGETSRNKSVLVRGKTIADLVP